MLSKNKTFGFGEAISHLKKGDKVARKGWNDMFIYLINGTKVPANALKRQSSDGLVSVLDTDKSMAVINPHIAMKATDNSIVIGWTASQTDMLSEDWQVVD